MKHFVYGVHIMWYELGMIEEHFTSLARAIEHATWPVDIVVCLNHQTFIEHPNDDTVMYKFYQTYMDAAKLLPPNPTFFAKTIYDLFYNIADFRREIQCHDGYTIWGEIDALLPTNYFAYLEQLSDSMKQTPHVASFASRKMWDASWQLVEHYAFQYVPRAQIKPPFDNEHYITQEQLDTFNDDYYPGFVELPSPKIDGCLLAIDSRVPQLIPDDMHFAREDYIAQCMLERLHIPQIQFQTVLKGHNYRHPKKRMYTNASRTDPIYLHYEKESFEAGMRFLNA